MGVLLVCDRCGEADPTFVLYTLEAHSINGRALIPLVDRADTQLCERCVADCVKVVEAWLDPDAKTKKEIQEHLDYITGKEKK